MKMSLGVDGLFTTISTAVSLARFYTNKLNSLWQNILLNLLLRKSYSVFKENAFSVEEMMKGQGFFLHICICILNKPIALPLNTALEVGCNSIYHQHFHISLNKTWQNEIELVQLETWYNKNITLFWDLSIQLSRLNLNGQHAFK